MDEQHLLKQIGLSVRTLRKAQGLTQEQLAEMAGLSYKYLGEIERGKINFGVVSLFKISQALKIPLKNIVVVTEEEKTQEYFLKKEISGLLAGRSADELKKIVKILNAVFL